MMKKLFVFAAIAVLAVTLTACATDTGESGPVGPVGPVGPQGPAGSAGKSVTIENTCQMCHNGSPIITDKQAAWAESVHGSGEAYVRGTSASCVGCHSGDGFVEMVSAGLNPGSMEAGDPEPTRQDCRTCHNIHMTYTPADWTLTTTEPVALYAFEGATFDGGKGNLCANCHQPRRAFEATDGIVNVSSTHWGPHHGPQSTMLLGLAGAGLEGSASSHATMVQDTCVSCHLSNHAFEPSVTVCQGCHTDVENFDINGVQTEVQALLDELLLKLEEAGLYHDGHPVVGEYPEAQAAALWNYIYIAVEDGSLGVHNPAYTIELLETSLTAFE